MRRTPLVTILLVLAACSSAPIPTFASHTASPSPTWAYCSELASFDALVQKVRKGTESPGSLVGEAERLHDHVVTFAQTITDPKGKKALDNLAEAVGTLELALSGAGITYALNSRVQIRAKALSDTALSASLENCT
jgi:hypothetical protein